MNRIIFITLIVTLLGIVNMSMADSHSDMAERSEFLLKKARDVIAKLEGEGKHDAAEGVKKVESFLLDIDGQIRRFHPHTFIGHAVQDILEGLLQKGEHMLEDIITKFDKDDIHGHKGEENNKGEEDNKHGNKGEEDNH